MKKRLLCILLALALVLAPLPVSAAQGASLRCGSGQGQSGDYLYLPITAEDLAAVAALELSLYYDPEVLEFISCGNGWLLDDALVSTHDSGGSLTLTAISAGGHQRQRRALFPVLYGPLRLRTRQVSPDSGSGRGL